MAAVGFSQLHLITSPLYDMVLLQILAALHGQDHVLMECSFPADYPNKPFFLRIISPRMCWYTGMLHSSMFLCISLRQ